MAPSPPNSLFLESLVDTKNPLYYQNDHLTSTGSAVAMMTYESLYKPHNSESGGRDPFEEIKMFFGGLFAWWFFTSLLWCFNIGRIAVIVIHSILLIFFFKWLIKKCIILFKWSVWTYYRLKKTWYRIAAAFNSAKAQDKLGYCYERGIGVAPNYTEAVKWYSKAVEQGYANAMYNLGYCYKYGIGVPKNYTEAVRWFRMAAEKENGNAQLSLGYCYAHSQGVPQDYDKAVEWYRKAAEKGIARAENNLGYCYSEGYGVPKNASEAVRWYSKAAKKGDVLALNNLGYCYRVGKGVPQDYAKANKYYRKVAKKEAASGAK